MPLPPESWRANLRPASFRGAGFKVDVAARGGGRRTTEHQFPKRDDPEAEDMGRQAKKFTLTGYVIGEDYTAQRDTLIAALETEGSGLLVHPTMGEFLVNPGLFGTTERRERGRMAEFEMEFLEAGSQSSTSAQTDTQGAVASSAADASDANAQSLANNLNGTPTADASSVIGSGVNNAGFGSVPAGLSSSGFAGQPLFSD